MNRSTPGPWFIEHRKTREHIAYVTFRPSADDEMWGWATIDGMNAEANAHLIAAAPAMLEGLEIIASGKHDGTYCALIAGGALSVVEGRLPIPFWKDWKKP